MHLKWIVIHNPFATDTRQSLTDTKDTEISYTCAATTRPPANASFHLLTLPLQATMFSSVGICYCENYHLIHLHLTLHWSACMITSFFSYSSLKLQTLSGGPQDCLESRRCHRARNGRAATGVWCFQWVTDTLQTQTVSFLHSQTFVACYY